MGKKMTKKMGMKEREENKNEWKEMEMKEHKTDNWKKYN